MDWITALFSHGHETVAACAGSFLAGFWADKILHLGVGLFAVAGWVKAWRLKRHHAQEHGPCETTAEAGPARVGAQIRPSTPWPRG